MKTVDISQPLGVDISTHLAANYPRLEYLQEIIFNSITGLFEDKKGNMNPVLNQVPVFNPNGIDDKLIFNDLSGVSIGSSLGTSTASIVGNEIHFTAGVCYGFLLSNGKLLRLQEFSGNTVYSEDGSMVGIISGSGSWWTRIDNAANFNQRGIKIVTYDGGKKAYLPTSLSDTYIQSNYSGVTNIALFTQNGKSLGDDGSLLVPHSEISDLVVEIISEKINTDFSSLDGFVEDDSAAAINNNIVEITTTAGYGSIKKIFNVESGKRYSVKSLVKTESGGQYRVRIDATSLAIFSKVGSETDFVEINDSFIADGTGTATVWLQNVTNGKTTYCDYIEISEIITISDHLINNNVALGQEFVIGQPLPVIYKHNLDEGVSTSGIKLQ